jgi:aryl-alcohol dehydrogenase-like predicted oxidoreductase
MAYGPLAHGLLAGEFKKGDNLKPDDWRSRYTLFEQPAFDKIMGIIEKLDPIAKNHKRELAHLAINWILSRRGVTCALVGMIHPWQVDANVKAMDWNLTSQDLKDIDKAITDADLGLRILPPDEYLEKTK